MMWGWDGYGYNWIGWTVGMIVMLVVLAGLVALGIWAVTSITMHKPKGDEADDILRQRLAKGEISEEQYDRLRSVLHQQS